MTRLLLAKRHSILLAVAVGFSLCVSEARAEQPTVNLEEGRAVFKQQCSRCHGITGAGDGPDAKRLFPKPRDLARGVYKFRTTATGTPPTDEDLFRTISEGLPGSGMPSFGGLDDETQWQLVAYVKSLSPVFAESQPQPLQLSAGAPGEASSKSRSQAAEPPASAIDHAKGKQLYNDFGCVACHGAVGRGNGPSALTLTDDLGEPIEAANLTQGWRYRGGHKASDVFARLMAGLDGTPMPSYVDAISPEDGWQVAHYVQSLQQAPQWGERLQVARVDGALPTAADDPAWEQAPRLDVPLDGAVYDDGRVVPTRVHLVSVWAVTDGEAIVWRLAWHDPSDSARRVEGEEPALPDAIALVLRPSGVTEEVGSVLVWPSGDAPKLDIVYWASDQVGATEAVAGSFEGLTGAALESAVRYDDGERTLVVRRPLRLNDAPGAAEIAADGAAVPVALVAWDGGNNEQGRVRSASTWITLATGTPAAPKSHASSH